LKKKNRPKREKKKKKVNWTKEVKQMIKSQLGRLPDL